jgi:hypothetical protein
VRKAKISAALIGKNHPNWLGGRTFFRRSSYRGPGWKSLAEKVRKRQGYCCKRCGISQFEKGQALDVNHIEPWFNFTETRKANRLSNLEALCRSCHQIIEQKVNRQLCFFFLPGPKGQPAGDQCYQALCTAEEVLSIRQLAAGGKKAKDIARDMQKPYEAVYSIIRYKTYRNIR